MYTNRTFSRGWGGHMHLRYLKEMYERISACVFQEARRAQNHAQLTARHRGVDRRRPRGSKDSNEG